MLVHRLIFCTRIYQSPHMCFRWAFLVMWQNIAKVRLEKYCYASGSSL